MTEWCFQECQEAGQAIKRYGVQDCGLFALVAAIALSMCLSALPSCLCKLNQEERLLASEAQALEPLLSIICLYCF